MKKKKRYISRYRSTRGSVRGIRRGLIFGSIIILFIIILVSVFFANRTIDVLLPVNYQNSALDSGYTSEQNSYTNPTYETTPESTSISTTATSRIFNDTDYVKVTDYIPTLYVDLKYATNDNITGQVIYDFTDAYLRYGTVKKLITVQNDLMALGYSMKIWDAYRPMEAQRKLWEVMPNAKYIANPSLGYRSHNLGNAIDVTLVTVDGNEVNMPTGFDNFTALADRNYKDMTAVQKEHALLLETTMVRCGFTPYSAEWWHFSDTVNYTYDESFKP